ncbi:MAG TPA: hypothetical protein VIL64_03510 [Solirubrobacteraceae bacterium]
MAVAGGVLLIAAELSTVVKITTGQVIRYRQHGYDEHGWAVLLLGVAAIPMAWGAARRRALPAVVALAAIAIATLVFAIAVDLPDTRSTGSYGVDYEDAQASAGPGLVLELLGAGALLVASGLGLTLRARE